MVPREASSRRCSRLGGQNGCSFYSSERRTYTMPRISVWSRDAEQIFRASCRTPCQSEGAKRRRFMPWLDALEDRTVPNRGYAFTIIEDPYGPIANAAFGTTSASRTVGECLDANIDAHTSLLRGGQHTTLDDPNTRNSIVPFGVHASGIVMGLYGKLNGHGFLLNRGEFTTVGNPNSTGLTDPIAISASGQMGGQYVGAVGGLDTILLSAGDHTTLDNAAAFNGIASFGVNACRQIVGIYYATSFISHGYSLSGGQSATVEEPNAVNGAQGEGVNNEGQIIG